MYLNTAARWTPHFVGFFLALCLVVPAQTSTTSRSKANSSKFSSFISTTVSLFLFVVSGLVVIFPFVVGVVNSRIARAKGPFHEDNFVAIASKNIYEAHASESNGNLTSASVDSSISFVDYYFVVLSRPVTSAAYAYVIYRLVYSRTQTQPSNDSLVDKIFRFVGSFLSLPAFQFVGHYSYLVYILHYRILFELVFRFCRPDYLDKVLLPFLPSTGSMLSNSNSSREYENASTSSNRGLAHIFIYATMTYGITLALSVIVGHLFESKIRERFRRLLEQILKLGLQTK